MKIPAFWIVVVLALLTSDSGARMPAPTYFYKLVAAETEGYVFFADADTPAIRIPVRIWDVSKREFIFETVTDDDGFFKLPQLGPGKYYITFDTIAMELEVVPNMVAQRQQLHDIIVVIPRGTASMPLIQLNGILMATTISEGALLYRNEDRETVVSP